MSTLDRILVALSGLGGIAVFALLVMIDNENSQGFVQKIFYLHVPCAWVAFLAFTVTGLSGLRYLMSRDMRHDRLASASAEVGLVFITLVIITGPLWAKPVWGIFWTWDLRLTTSFILWLMFLAYVILRRSVGEPERRATLSAVVGLVGFLNVPVVYMANRVKASQHPAPVIAGGEDSGLAPEFLATLLTGVVATTLLYVVFVRSRIRSAALEEQVEELWIETNAQRRA